MPRGAVAAKRAYCEARATIATCVVGGSLTLEIKGGEKGDDGTLFVLCTSNPNNPRLRKHHRVRTDTTSDGRVYFKIYGWAVFLKDCVAVTTEWERFLEESLEESKGALG